MAGAPGPSATRLRPLEELRRAPERFGLFAALRLLEQAFPQRPRLGEARKAADDAVRLGHKLAPCVRAFGCRFLRGG